MSTIATFYSPYRLHDMDFIESDTADRNDEPVSNLQEFRIRTATSHGTRDAASMLLKKMYSWRGYFLEPSPRPDPNKLMLMAETGGKAVGTMTLCFDSDVALPADDNFHDTLDELRAKNRRLCEPSRLAIDRNTPKRVFAALMHISYIYTHRIFSYTDFFIEVNPRHADFYKRMLGFRELGRERMCTRVNAPAVLLHLECRYMTNKIQKLGDSFENQGKEKCFYPYFFFSHEEQRITQRLMTSRQLPRTTFTAGPRDLRTDFPFVPKCVDD